MSATFEERIEQASKDVHSKVKLLGDGLFEPFHFAGDAELTSVMAELMADKTVKSAGALTALIAVSSMMMMHETSSLKPEERTKQILEEVSGHMALFFLTAYRLGRKDAEVELLERMAK